MARAKTPQAKLATTVGMAHYTYLDKPDTEGQYADGKYKITVSFDASDPFVATLRAKIDQLAAEHWGDSIPRKVNLLLKDEEDTPNEAFAGRVFFRAKSAKQPAMVDAKNASLPESVRIFSGDLVRVGITLAVYDGAQKGVTAYLDAVKLIEKRGSTGGAASVDALFGEDEGYEAPAGELAAEEDGDF